MTMRFATFTDAISTLKSMFPKEPIHTERWQGVDISKRPEMAMHEVLFPSFRVSLTGEDLEQYRQDVKPNLPWADNHFLERVCGYPINPGVEWANWPNGKSAETFLEDGRFNHNYMERYWPKYAGLGLRPTLTAADFKGWLDAAPQAYIHEGIRHQYGDLAGVVRHLAGEPLTRQAYFPVWFPEDTGDAHSGRKPCTLGYHFIMRKNRLHLVYYIRSCDFVRHFRDDIYLTVRLLLWVLDECRKLNENWISVEPGDLLMHISSLHMFRNDYLLMTQQG